MKTADTCIKLSYGRTDFLFSRGNIVASLFFPGPRCDVPANSLTVSAADSGVVFEKTAVPGVLLDGMARRFFNEQVSAVPKLALVLHPAVLSAAVLSAAALPASAVSAEVTPAVAMPDNQPVQNAGAGEAAGIHAALICSAQPQVVQDECGNFSSLPGVIGRYVQRYGISGFRFSGSERLEILLDVPVFLRAAIRHL